ncbi:TMV resistance protein N-like protein [Tanacetum coccineum]
MKVIATIKKVLSFGVTVNAGCDGSIGSESMLVINKRKMPTNIVNDEEAYSNRKLYFLISIGMDGSLVASTSSSSSSTTALTGRWTYDVFLSFCGGDTRKKFVDHLYSALDRAGIYTFKDDKKLLRGKSISPELTKAIEESMVAVVIFSKKYSNSYWCLDELVKIMHLNTMSSKGDEERISHKKTKNQAKSDKTGHGMEKLSYDGLNILEKKMFLEIACFFKGYEILHVTRILDSLGFEAVSGITVMIEKSLLTIVYGKLHMHDLIQEMGQYIVKECYPDTMLWVPDEVEERLENVEAIEHEHYSRSMTCYDVDVFKSMKKLRLLILKRRFTSSEPRCFPKQLRCDSGTKSGELNFVRLWAGGDPPTLYPDEISSDSASKYLFELERFPEVTREMRMLLLLDMNGCDSIRALPTSIQLLTGLGSTHLRCLRILGFKNNNVVEGNYLTRNMHNAWPSLEEVDLSHNFFTRLPASISQLSRLKYFDLRSCYNLEELRELPSLVQILKTNFCKRLQKTDDLSNKYKWLFKISFFYNPLEDRETQSHLDNLLMKSFVQKCAVVNHRLSIVVRGTNGTQNNFRIKFKRSGEEKLSIRPSGADARGLTHVWIGYMSINILRNLCHGSESEYLIITFEYDGNILECGVCVIYEDDIDPMTGSGSRIKDYDELRTIERDNASSENLQQGRWSTPTFSFGDEKTGDQNTVKVFF